MSQVIDFCEDSDDGEWPNSTSCPSLQLSGKRPRDEESSYTTHPRKENGPGKKTSAGSTEFVVDLELADEVEVSTSKKRRGVVRSDPSVRNDASGLCLQVLKGVHAHEQEVANEDAQVASHRESHEAIAVAAVASHPRNSESKKTNQKEGSANKHSEKLSTSKPSWNALGRQRRASVGKPV
jgi:hypothetical protein